MKHFQTTPADQEHHIGLWSLGDVPGLTAISSNITDSHNGISFGSCSTLESVSYPLLNNIGPTIGYAAFTNCAALTVIDFPALQNVSASVIVEQCPAITALNFPLLLQVLGFSSANNPACVSINLPILSVAASVMIGVAFGSGAANDGALTSVNLDVLNAAGVLQVEQCSALTSLSFPQLISTSTSLKLSHCTALTSISLPLWLPVDGQQVICSDNALDQTSVDLILARCVANAAFVSGAVSLNGGTNATPSASGLTDKATLTGRGVTVLTN
jgi:hypothetical protein